MPESKKVNFEWFVLNGNFNKRCIEPYNIFNNYYVNEKTNELCKDYFDNKLTKEEFAEKLDKTIMYEEWSRTEYEICVAEWPPTYLDRDRNPIYNRWGTENKDNPIYDVQMWKIDCHYQAHMNLKQLVEYVLNKYSSEVTDKTRE